MRLGSIIYFVPFFFVLNPALIGKGPIGEIALVLTTAIVGIVIISSGLQGYLYGVGTIDRGISAWPGRILLVLGGLILALPANERVIGLTHFQINASAIVIILVGVALCWVARSRGPGPASPVPG